MMNVAIIGISGFANRHHQDLLGFADKGVIRLVAATVINQSEEVERCAGLQAMGCELFSDYREMLSAWKGRLDLCVIPTGIHLHARMTLAALDAGCNVLVEKPAAATVQEIDTMIVAEAKSSRFVAVGYQHLYAPEVARMKRVVLDGLIGTVEAVKCKGLWPRSDGYYQRNDWAGRVKSGEDWILDAPFNNAFAHYLNMLCFFAGNRFEESTRVETVRAELYRAREIETADTACMRVETADGIPLFLWVTHSCEKRGMDDEGPELEIRGSHGSLIWTPQRIIHRSLQGEEDFWPVSDIDQIRSAMLEAVLQRISGEEVFTCGLKIARVQTLCSSAAFESSRVHSIPLACLRGHGNPKDRFTEIRGIETLCAEAFQQERLWSEMAVPWARAGREIRLFEDGDFGAGEAECQSSAGIIEPASAALASKWGFG